MKKLIAATLVATTLMATTASAGGSLSSSLSSLLSLSLNIGPRSGTFASSLSRLGIPAPQIVANTIKVGAVAGAVVGVEMIATGIGLGITAVVDPTLITGKEKVVEETNTDNINHTELSL